MGFGAECTSPMYQYVPLLSGWGFCWFMQGLLFSLPKAQPHSLLSVATPGLVVGTASAKDEMKRTMDNIDEESIKDFLDHFWRPNGPAFNLMPLHVVGGLT